VKSLRTGEPMTAATAVNIGSCSKAFVSAAMASLVADKLASWDDPVSKWVPEFQLHDATLTRQVTLRDLSGNRLGIPRAGLVEFGFDPSQTAAAALEGLRHTAPVCGLRERHTYVNGGHTAVALAVGRITSKGFLPTLHERILAPLGMHGTSGGLAARDALPDQSGWHCLVDGSTQAIDTVCSDWYLGGGGMSVSGAAALQWLRFHLNGGLVDGRQIVPREALLETHTPQIVAWPGKDIISLFHPGAHMAAYGLGWAVTELEGHPLVIHSGGDFGIAAMTLLFPRDGIGIACYCNSSGRGTIALPYALAACLLGLKPRDWKAYFEAAMPASAPAATVPATSSSTDPGIHAGCYAHPADGELLIEHDGNGLKGNFLHGYRMAFSAAPAGDRRFVIHFDSPEWRSLTAADKPLLVFDAGGGPSTMADWIVGPYARRFTRDA
jgi:CubicO group peptidase (beta-lactamase class C family)